MEDDVRVGDRFRIGTAELVVTQPRKPCFKLSGKLQRRDVIRRFLTTGRTGWYFAVAQEGHVQPGDPIVRVLRSEDVGTIAELVRGFVVAGRGHSGIQ